MSEVLPLSGPPVSALQLNGQGSQLRISPITARASTLTLEAWLCSSAVGQRRVALLVDSGPQTVVLTVNNGQPQILTTSAAQLALCVGGSQHELAVLVAMDGTSYAVCTANQSVQAGVWTHVALTIQRTADLYSPTVISLYRQGQLVQTQTLNSSLQLAKANPLLGLSHPELIQPSQWAEQVLNSVLTPTYSLGGVVGANGQTGAIGTYAGQLAEVRLWTVALSAADIASRFLTRAVGNESSLGACYRLEHIKDGCIYDISAQRGLGSVPSGSSIVTAAALPLSPTASTQTLSLDLQGKLVTEQIVLVTPGNPETPAAQAQTMTVFDATIRPISPDGNLLVGKQLHLWPDGDVTVLLDQGDAAVATPWTGGQRYDLRVPATGQIRLRFLASDLVFPALRVRIGGMPDGIWSLVRPDVLALQKLQSATSQDLQAPGNGAASPLPAGTSAASAAIYAQTLQTLGSAIVASRTPAAATPSLRINWNSIVSTLSEGARAVAGGLNSLLQGTRNGLQVAGSAAGTLRGALIDDGTAALASATKYNRKAEDFVLTSGEYLSDLVVATTLAVPRTGAAAIELCISSAILLSVVASGTAGEILHSFTLIGTSILADGSTVVWRAVCSGVNDAVVATRAFLKRVGADVAQFRKYLAWLFKWQDFLDASDEIYTVLQQQLAQVPQQLGAIAPYRDKIKGYLTLPSGIADQSLAELCQISIPKTVSFAELDYLIELAQKVMSSPNLNLAGVQKLNDAILQLNPNIGTSPLKGSAEQSASNLPTDILSSPQALLTMSLQQLVNALLTGSSQTTVVDYMFNALATITSDIAALIAEALTGHIDVPLWTAMIESAILGGRPLNLLRLAALGGAIAQVLTVKLITSAQSESLSPQPVSFGTQSTVAIFAFANFALSSLFSILEVMRVAAEAKGGDEAGTSKIGMSTYVLDALLGMVIIARAGLTFPANLGQSARIQAAMGMQAVLDVLAGGTQLVCAFLKAKNAADGNVGWFGVKGLKVVELVVQSGITAMCMIAAGCEVGLGELTSKNDWSSFALQSGGYLFTQLTLLTTAVVDLSPKWSAGPPLQKALVAATFGCDLASAILDATIALQAVE